MGEFTSSLFKVVTITLLSSWVIALTIVPVLCVLFLRAAKKATTETSVIEQRYAVLLRGLLNNQKITLVVTALVFSVALAGFQYVPKLFFPPSDRPYFIVELELPTGT